MYFFIHKPDAWEVTIFFLGGAKLFQDWLIDVKNNHFIFIWIISYTKKFSFDEINLENHIKVYLPKYIIIIVLCKKITVNTAYPLSRFI